MLSNPGGERRRLFDGPMPAQTEVPIAVVPSPPSGPTTPPRYINIEDEDSIKVDINDPSEAHYTHSLTEEEKQAKIKDGIKTGALLLLALFIIMWALIYLDFIIIPLVFSRFLVYLVQPFINLLVGKKPWPYIKKKMHLPRGIAVLVSFLLILVLLILLGLVISSSVREVLHDKDKYIERYGELMDSALSLGESWGYNRTEVQDMLPSVDFGAIIMDVVSGLMNFVPNAFLILLFTLYMLLDYNEKQLKSRLRAEVDKQIRTYIIIKVCLSAIGGFVAAVSYLIFGVPFALLFALLTFILNFIPNIGSIISYILPIPILILQPEMLLWKKITAVAIPLVFDMFMGNVVEPKVLGSSMDMPAITVLISLMFWGQIWGILGAILSVPLTTTIITYLKSIDHPMPRFLANVVVGDFSFIDPDPNPTVGVSSSIRKKKKKKVVAEAANGDHIA
eukprot:TRINITY_DN5606_c0_g1_i1.p1 TRINITY_DN5606_c0_g1~~TRINITY_DN5606_c0_g1_i1.p1  ORF type:complete len:449 (-),score=121.75 TRINITY_DN5606_c0_g1_i1:830-2176(-)